MKILTDAERTALLTKLAEAPDDILLEAVARTKQYYVDVKEDMKSLNGFVGIRFTEAPKMALSPPVIKENTQGTKEQIKEVRKDGLNIEPPGPAAKRITTTSKDAIMNKLRVPATADQVNKFLARGAGKIPETAMLLRRLWDLGLITFDGTNYEVKK